MTDVLALSVGNIVSISIKLLTLLFVVEHCPKYSQTISQNAFHNLIPNSCKNRTF